MTARKHNHTEWRSQAFIERLSDQDRVFGENYRALLRNTATRVLRIRTDRGNSTQFDVIRDWQVRNCLARKRREEEARRAIAQRREHRLEVTEKELFA